MHFHLLALRYMLGLLHCNNPIDIAQIYTIEPHFFICYSMLALVWEFGRVLMKNQRNLCHPLGDQ